MALTPSKMIPIGTPAPRFSLKDELSGKTIRLDDYAGKKAVAIMFLCNHCPYVKHIQSGLVQMTKSYAGNADVAFIAINSNDAKTHPDDSPQKMQMIGRELNYNFPYCFDESQSVAKSYQATCTPDFYVLDSKLNVAYRGQMDDSRPANGVPVSGKDLRQAIDALVAGKTPSEDQKPSIGCNIKWKNE